MTSVRTSLLAVLVIFSGSILAQMVLSDEDQHRRSSGERGTTLPTVQTSQKPLGKLDDDGKLDKMALDMEFRHHKLLETVEKMSNKINLLDKKIETSNSKITKIENLLSELNSRINGKVDALQVALKDVTETLHINYTTSCHVSSETAGLVKNITTRKDDLNVRTSNISDTSHKMNDTMLHLTGRADLVVPDLRINNSKPNDLVNSITEQGHNISAALNITTEVNNPGPSKSDHSQQEEGCTVAIADLHDYKQYIEMAARGRHTAVNMTSAGLQEYTMYFAVKGVWAYLQLSPTSPVNEDDLYYRIMINGRGYIFLVEHLSRDTKKVVQDVHTTNLISLDRYTFYYLSISGDTLKVGRRGEPPLLTHTSTELRRLRYFSHKRSFNVAGAVLYDCTAQ